MSFCNSYIDFKNWVLQILDDSEHIENIDFNKIIERASRLPIPDTTEKYQNLIDTGLCYILDKLASTLGDFTESDNLTNITKPEENQLKKRLNSYLTELWEIWEKYFMKPCWNQYAAHLINSDRFQERLSALNYAYCKLFHLCDKCKKTDIRIPSSTRIPDELHLKNIGASCSLSRSLSICGCEGFVSASERLVNERVFERIYGYWKSSDIYKMQLLWIPFILCAGKLKRSDILKDILESMKTMYQEINLTNAILLLKFGWELNVNEIFEYFDYINTSSHWDLSTPYSPILDSFLSAYYIENNTTDQLKLEFRSLEGKFWKEYFENLFEEKNQENSNLFTENKNVLQFHEKSLSDWNTTICFAQEIYVRELRFRLYEELQNQFSHFDYLNDENFLDKIRSGDISKQIKKYQKKVGTIFNPISCNYIRDEFLDHKFLPFIDFFLSNHISFFTDRENYYQWQNNDEAKDLFFKKAEKLFKNINPEMISDQEWQYFLSLLVIKIKENAAVFLLDQFLSELHSMKRIFADKFENPEQNVNVPLPEENELVTNARKFIKNIYRYLPRYRITEPKKIDIIPEIQQHLIDDYYKTENVIDLQKVIYISGYDGICEDYLRPILIEIRSNAEKALSYIQKMEHRHYQVNTQIGKNDYSDFLMLSVTNNFIKNINNDRPDPLSTGNGLKNIQHYSTFFRKGARQGWAQFKIANRKTYDFFIVQIYFPLWEEVIKEKFSHE